MSDLHQRKPLPETRRSTTHRVTITDQYGNEYDVYIRAGYYDDGKLGEVFANVGKQGSMLAGVLDGWAVMVSIALQYGVPLAAIVRKFKDQRFEPSGVTSNPDIPLCASILDYIVHWLAPDVYEQV